MSLRTLCFFFWFVGLEAVFTESHCIDQADLTHKDPTATASPMLALKVCTTMPKSHSSQPEMHYVAQACLNYMDASAFSWD